MRSLDRVEHINFVMKFMRDRVFGPLWNLLNQFFISLRTSFGYMWTLFFINFMKYGVNRVLWNILNCYNIYDRYVVRPSRFKLSLKLITVWSFVSCEFNYLLFYVLLYNIYNYLILYIYIVLTSVEHIQLVIHFNMVIVIRASGFKLFILLIKHMFFQITV